MNNVRKANEKQRRAMDLIMVTTGLTVLATTICINQTPLRGWSVLLLITSLILTFTPTALYKAYKFMYDLQDEKAELKAHLDMINKATDKSVASLTSRSNIAAVNVPCDEKLSINHVIQENNCPPIKITEESLNCVASGDVRIDISGDPNISPDDLVGLPDYEDRECVTFDDLTVPTDCDEIDPMVFNTDKVDKEDINDTLIDKAKELAIEAIRVKNKANQDTQEDKAAKIQAYEELRDWMYSMDFFVNTRKGEQHIGGVVMYHDLLYTIDYSKLGIRYDGVIIQMVVATGGPHYSMNAQQGFTIDDIKEVLSEALPSVICLNPDLTDK